MINLKVLELNNFRCYSNSVLQFSENVNIIYGDNATGKTSIVEAIALLGTCKSFKTNNDKELIKSESENYLIKYTLLNNNDNKSIKLSCDGKNKKLFVNEKLISPLSDYVGTIKTLVFSPEDIRIVTDDPKNRRKFLDRYIGLLNKQYLKTIIRYNKVLKERNELLKAENIDLKLLDVYTNELIECSCEIINHRKEFINKLNLLYNDKINKLSLDKDCGNIVYKPNVDVDNIKFAFNNNLNYDLITKTTNCGPHRDDFTILLNDYDADSYGSQGQIKTLALALKLCVVDIAKEIDDNIIVILDDVFGELDSSRQNQILSLFDDKYQLFITTTSIDNIKKEILEKSNLIKIIRKGEING